LEEEYGSEIEERLVQYYEEEARAEESESEEEDEYAGRSEIGYTEMERIEMYMQQHPELLMAFDMETLRQQRGASLANRQIN
jgi:hypothetical protein